jgi:hypothetical protein
MSQLIQDFYGKLQSIMPANSVHAIANTKGGLPSIVYTVRESGRDAFYKDSFGLRETKFQVDVYSLTFAELNTLKDLIRENFHGFSGVVGSSVFQRTTVDLMIDTYEDGDEFLYRSIIEITVLD